MSNRVGRAGSVIPVCAMLLIGVQGVRAQSTSSSEDMRLQEIIVTAQKKSERLQDVPVPVTVLEAGTLAELNQSRLQDYFATVPGLSLTQAGPGLQSLSIRGITTSFISNPTVGVTIDDVPYGSSTLLGFGAVVLPDIDPSDLERIEVLRGPQGTLYGADSLGGLIKYVTKDPSTEGLSGHVQVLGDGVQHGGYGYGLRAAVNVPVSDTIAIRASGFTRRDPGFITNATSGRTDVNGVDVSGGRLSALWRPSEALSLKLSALLQNTDASGSSLVDANNSLQPTVGDLEQARQIAEPYSSRVRLYTATLTAKLGRLDFTSISAYGDNKFSSVADATVTEASFAQQFFNVSGADQGTVVETQKFTQEFRLASPTEQTLEWLLGAFYAHEKSPEDQFDGAIDLATGSRVGTLVSFILPTKLEEYAAFADLTVHFTDRFDVQFGGRESENRQVYNETDVGPLVPYYDGVPSSPYTSPSERTNGNAFTYLVTPRFKFSPDLMAYARLASGYRFGGNNIVAALGNIPPSYDPDKTNNYELGLKGELLDRALSFDASAYYVTWKRIQIALYNPTTFAGYDANGGNAKSEGLELSVQARPAKGLSLNGSVSFNDAKLTEDFPATATAVGFAGDRLPYSSRFSGNISVDQDFSLARNWTGFAGLELSYVGAREGEFESAFIPVPRFNLPAYATVDLHTGARHDAWTVNFFAKNVTDRRGILGGIINSALATNEIAYIQPRTVGLSIARDF